MKKGKSVMYSTVKPLGKPLSLLSGVDSGVHPVRAEFYRRKLKK